MKTQKEIRLSLTLCAVIILMGCGSSVESVSSKSKGIEDTLRVPMNPTSSVAVVNGNSLSTDSLLHYVKRNSDVPRQQVVDRFIVAELLYKDAQEKGYADDHNVQLAWKRLMVQAMLKEKVEDKLDKLPTDELNEYYKTYEGEFYQPTIRLVDNLLIRPNSKKWNVRKDKESIPQKVYDEADEAMKRFEKKLTLVPFEELTKKKMEELIEEFKPELSEDLEFTLETALKVPVRSSGMPRTKGYVAPMVKEFTAGVYAVPLEHLSKRIHTMFGVHIAVVRSETLEKQLMSKDAALPILEKRILVKLRKRAAQKLFMDINKDAQILVNEDILGKLIVTDEKKSSPSK